MIDSTSTLPYQFLTVESYRQLLLSDFSDQEKKNLESAPMVLIAELYPERVSYKLIYEKLIKQYYRAYCFDSHNPSKGLFSRLYTSEEKTLKSFYHYDLLDSPLDSAASLVDIHADLITPSTILQRTFSKTVFPSNSSRMLVLNTERILQTVILYSLSLINHKPGYDAADKVFICAFKVNSDYTKLVENTIVEIEKFSIPFISKIQTWDQTGIIKF